MSVDSHTEPGHRVETAPVRVRVQVRARTRHPVAWLRSTVTRRRGVGGADVPTGADEVLDRLGELPVSVWTYGFDHRSVRHLGPMAQDFAAAFGLGSSTRRIETVDALGVCMAGIQALQRRVVALETELGRQSARHSPGGARHQRQHPGGGEEQPGEHPARDPLLPG